MNHCKITLPYTIKIIGEAGDGIISAGDMLLEALYSYGLYASSYREFPPTIRQGATASMIRIASTPILAPVTSTDCLFLGTRNSVISEITNCRNGCVIIVDTSYFDASAVQTLLESKNRSDITLCSLPAQNDCTCNSRFFSSRILGILGAFLNLPLEHLDNAVCNQFSTRKAALIDKNLAFLRSSYEFTTSILPSDHATLLPAPGLKQSEFTIADGNECTGYGALACFCSFFSSYPITPSTSIGSFLSTKLPAHGGFIYQAEDEIAAIGAAIGASFSGAKSMTATSGPGLSLMQEFIGYASMVELPIVIVDVQRGGPSTGSPTQSGQEDLCAAAFGSHGESPKIVLAPIDTADCFFTTCEAFDCAEQYQCPVILLSDSILGFTKSIIPSLPDQKETMVSRNILTIQPPVPSQTSNDFVTTVQSGNQNGTTPTDYHNGFKRYKLSHNGLNPIPVPGISPIAYCVTGLEHDEYGYPTSSSQMRMLQQQRRFRKLSALETEHSSLIDRDGDNSHVDCAVVAWGSSVSSTKEAISALRATGISVAALYPRLLFPVCTHSINWLLALTERIIVIESNYTGQYAKLIRMYTDARPVSITSISGTPFNPEYLHSEITAQLRIWDNGNRA